MGVVSDPYAKMMGAHRTENGERRLLFSAEFKWFAVNSFSVQGNRDETGNVQELNFENWVSD